MKWLGNYFTGGFMDNLYYPFQLDVEEEIEILKELSNYELDIDEPVSYDEE